MPITIRDKPLENDNDFRREAPEILDMESAARYLGVSVRILADNVEKLGIPHRMIGRTMIFSRSALVRWVES